MLGVLCLAMTIFHESRGEPDFGQKLVAEIVMSRVKSDKFPDNICDVVTERRQFSYLTKNNYLKMPDDNEAWEKAMSLAHEAINNYIDGSMYSNDPQMLFYHSTSVNPVWNKKMRVSYRVGKHIFLTERKTAPLQSVDPKTRLK